MLAVSPIAFTGAIKSASLWLSTNPEFVLLSKKPPNSASSADTCRATVVSSYLVLGLLNSLKCHFCIGFMTQYSFYPVKDAGLNSRRLQSVAIFAERDRGQGIFYTRSKIFMSIRTFATDLYFITIPPG